MYVRKWRLFVLQFMHPPCCSLVYLRDIDATVNTSVLVVLKNISHKPKTQQSL